MRKIEEAKRHLKELGVDGWLLYDFHGNNELARTFLKISRKEMVTRRFLYWIPVEGDPVKVVHAIEPHVLDKWPGEKRVFLSWRSFEEELKRLLEGKKRIAMEYSEKNRIPYISKVDAGTADLIRSYGVEIVSSGPFLPYFSAVLSQEELASHFRAAHLLKEIVKTAWSWVVKELKEGRQITEYDLQQKILEEFKSNHLMTEAPPIVAVNAHSADPHYEPKEGKSSPIQAKDFLLIDLWAKEEGERTIYADLTKVAAVLSQPTEKQKKIFQIVSHAQEAGFRLIESRFSAGQEVLGAEVDDAVRKVIEKAGFGEYFIHRTGHSIETELHGSGAHIDNLEMEDLRPLLKGTCFSIEPGIYLPGEFGIRLESDVVIDHEGKVHITGGVEKEIVVLEGARKI